MSLTTQRLSARDFTRLPVEEVQLTDQMGVDIMITTPHKGKVILKTKERISGFFSGTKEFNANQEKLLQEIKQLEKDSIEYLFKNWLKSIKDK